MAEEHGKGIALVILGIVAIIAIVGLVLLFTGARKTATGEFSVGVAKTYGNAISNPRATSDGFAGQAYGSSGVMKGGQCYGDACAGKSVLGSDSTTFNREPCKIPSAQRSCQSLSAASGLNLGNHAGEQEKASSESQGLQCVAVADLNSLVCGPEEGGLGMSSDSGQWQSIPGYCCADASLNGYG